MLSLPVVLAWGLALLVALVAIAFCAYEIRWKLARLQRDAIRLSSLIDEAAAVEHALKDAQRRLSGLRGAGAGEASMARDEASTASGADLC